MQKMAASNSMAAVIARRFQPILTALVHLSGVLECNGLSGRVCLV
jgi:hypothetical protein